MINRSKRIGAAALFAAPLLMATGRPPADEPFVCAITSAVECPSDLACEAPEFLRTPPSFLHVDLDRKAVTMLAPEERRGEVTPILGLEQLEDRVLLSGIEGDRSWSAVILDDGTMSLTIAAEESGFVVFARCLPESQTRP